jgi:hypothetical protein
MSEFGLLTGGCACGWVKKQFSTVTSPYKHFQGLIFFKI